MTLPEAVTSYLARVDAAEVASIERLEGAACQTAPEPQEHSKLAYYDQASSGDRFVVHLRQKSLSRIRVDLSARSVTKVVGRYTEFGIVSREVDWLVRLGASAHAPALLSHSGSRLTLRYVGEPVRQSNLPADWRSQAEALLMWLKAERCAHNDIKCDNITVLDGRLHLIDFGWATRIGDAIPRDWPAGIGRQHRIETHVFDDRHALFAALQSAERGMVDHSIVMPG